MTPLEPSVGEALRSKVDSSTFSFRSPSVVEEVWTSIQDAPDHVCEEFVLIGDHILRACFLSVMLKREFPRPNGFLATVRDLVLSANVYAALVTRAGIQWRGASTRPAAEAFLIFAAALHTTLDNYRAFLDWFRETFVPLIQVVEEMYGITQSNPATYAPALDILAQIKTIQLQWRVWNGSQEDEGPLPASASLQKASFLIWNASTSAGKELATLAGATISPVIRLAENTIRASTPKWFRSRKLKRANSQRRVSSILDSRPSLASRALLNPEALTGIPHPPAFAGPASNYASRPPPQATTTPISPLSASSNGPYPFRYTVTTRPKETAPNPAPLMLPRTPNSGFRNIWTE
ncbi:hypothetical protein B0H16DRAFT_1721535 [Mycena metata]|uniref:RNase III domain-containing protein n=1 Tax=Mycena metata TaxID=1033252 RepID=A0AAD7NF10_9AGAR|nr:hypothetical protein B0H16DRAFT_1721535 [Mycena metata]